MEAERAGRRFIGHAAIAGNHVKAVGPAGVSEVGGIVEGVGDRRDLDSKLRDANLPEVGALIETLGTRQHDVVPQIVADLPGVACVRFTDVNNEEGDLIPIFIVQLVQGGNLPPKWRSSVAAEDEYDGPLSAERRQLEMALVIGTFEREIWRSVAHIQVASSR